MVPPMSDSNNDRSAARRKMIERVRALLAKNIASGCTEGEALAALEKARELMAAYEIAETDILPETEKAQIFSTGHADPYRVKWQLSHAVGKFTRCRPWRSYCDGVTFCGLESEVDFAAWLLNTLQQFVLREVQAYRAELVRENGRAPRIMSSSFVHGVTERISDRLLELVSTEPTGKGKDLMLSRNALIEAAMAAAGISNLRKVRTRTFVNLDAYGAGKSVGNAATFSRPLNSGGALRLRAG
jgi:hypothetical protein